MKPFFLLFVIIVCWLGAGGQTPPATERPVDENEQSQRDDQKSSGSSLDWESTNRLVCPSFIENNNVRFVDMRRSKVVFTDNEGANWKEIDNIRSFCVEFWNEKIGWSIYDAVSITGDGGGTWSKMRPLHPTALLPSQIEFIDPLNGWAVDSFYVYKTNDGGRTWTRNLSYREELAGQPGRLFVSNRRSAWLCDVGGKTHSRVYGTKNGRNWSAKRITAGSSSYCDVFFVGERDGWYLPGWQYLYSTSNGGLTWRKSLVAKNFETRSMFWLDEQLGWIAGFFSKSEGLPPKLGVGAVLKTVDGGKTWIEVLVPKKEAFYVKVHFTSRQNGWLIARDKIYKTSDAGATWKLSYAAPLIDAE